MIKKLSKRSAGNKIYSIVGWFCYIACTIISAILNIYLLSKLDQSWAWFLLTMSLSLEFGKAYILIKANTYRSLAEYLKNCKFIASKVISKERIFYSLYVLFAVLSITASLCFSLTITDKTEQGFSLQKQEISQNIDTVEKSQIRYEEALSKFTMLQDNKELSEKTAKENLRSTKEAYEEAGIKLDKKAQELCAAAGDDPKNWTRYRKGTPEYDKYRDDIGYEKITREYNYAREDYDDIVSGKALVRAEETYNNSKADYDEKVKLYGSLESLKLQLSSINKEELEMAGSSKCFILLANTFGVPDKVKTIKFIILLYVSLLVELCIWLSSPDLRLDGDLLYTYRNDLGLSTKKDVDKLLKEIKDTNKRFSAKDEEEKVKVIEKVPVKTLKELDNLKEQVELLTREKEENEAIVKDLHMQYSDQIDKLNNKISLDQNSFEEDSEEKLKVINDMEDNYRKLEEEMESLKAELKEAQNESEEVAHLNNSKIEYMSKQEETIKELGEKIKLLEKEKNDGDTKTKEFEKELHNAKKEISSLKDNLAIAEASVNEGKYTEEDIKDVVKKTAEKSKKEIKSLKEQVTSWEEAYNKMATENSNLKIANSSLENNNKQLVLKNKELVEKEEVIEEPKEEIPLNKIKVGTLEEEAQRIIDAYKSKPKTIITKHE